MHTLGKVLAFLVVVGAGIGAAIASRTVVIRSGYMKKIDEQNERLVKNAAQLEELQTKEQNLRSDLARLNLGWDRVWDGVGTQIQNDASIVISMGTNVGLTIPADQNLPVPVLHAFQPGSNGEYVYVGMFAASDVRENQSLLVPTFVPRLSEVSTWQNGNWRFRSLIPAGYTERFLNLAGRLNTYDQLKEAKTANLEAQTQLKLVAEQHLKNRLNELNGNPDFQNAEGKLPPEDVKGYVATITDVEEQRNQAWEVVDELRRRLFHAHSNMVELIKANRELAGKLPATPAAETSGEVEVPETAAK
ncbi:MAG: hypothetical protein O2955_07480 [Planctomycetota bacterium]|nr:hypothetical protein [Planctomycetota bacterium]MDA1212340.1 hypothetical protein [Planctomycetota bacterium]